MSKKMDRNKILRGSYGRVWVDGEKYANVKTFEAKVTLEYEDVQIMGDLWGHKRLMGLTGAGTMTLHKIDSTIANKLSDIQNGEAPEITIIAALEDPSGYGYERVELTEVSLDELTLIKFENKTVLEEEVPFTFAGYNFIDKIE